MPQDRMLQERLPQTTQTRTIARTRTRSLNSKPEQANGRCVVYLMTRDQRVHDNWALLEAQAAAGSRGEAGAVPVIVVFELFPTFGVATKEQYDFMLTGLQETERELATLGIPLVVIHSELQSPNTIARFLEKLSPRAVYVDFFPLRATRQRREKLATQLSCAVREVDAHNCIPAWITSEKQEFAARTIRPKINRLLPEYLTEFPPVVAQGTDDSVSKHLTELRAQNLLESPNWNYLDRHVQARSIGQQLVFKPGMSAAEAALNRFLTTKLEGYATDRNDPTLAGQSGLSPYLHFGHISAQRVALAVQQSGAPLAAQEVFLEELIVRKELSDNFCLYNDHYDSFAGFPAWAQKTLSAHRQDAREFIYDLETFATATTHDALWNAAQREMLQTGKMHGYMRMYWAKKILEWTPSPEVAQDIAIQLNDTYSLDGRDPNGYVGIAWSIGGVHDRPWFERPVYGSIRYMNASGAAKKFAVKDYCGRFLE